MVSRRKIEQQLTKDECVDVGKVVFLKSGGQPMTVRSKADGKVTCEWFDKTGRYRSMEFLEHSLTGRKPMPDGSPAGVLVIGRLDDETSGESSPDA
ncbi:MAG: DUF2158 domain-containing protein [Hyphomicrobiaceae bacterium]